MRRPASQGAQDANQPEIVKALKRAGTKVQDLSAVGGGCADLLCWHPVTKVLALLEVKVPEGKLNEKQEKWHAIFPGKVVRSVDDAFQAMGLRRAGA